jgi:hypothetical protein
MLISSLFKAGCLVDAAEYRPHPPLSVDPDCYSLCKPKV